MATHLHTYQCWACKTNLTTPARRGDGQAVRCNLCRTPMRYLYSTPITTEEERALAAKGPVYNAGLAAKPPPRCPCGRIAGLLYGVTVGDVRYCSPRCADARTQPADALAEGSSS